MRRRTLLALLVVGAVMVPLGVHASHRFTDVPDSHTFHNAIDWMADNGITVGCNPPANTNYCPEDNVTRGQMAAFMKRLAENGVVDAATLRGQNTSAFQSPIWGAGLDLIGQISAPLTGSVTAGSRVLAVSVSPSANGVLSLTYHIVAGGLQAFSGYVWLQYDNDLCHLLDNRVDATAVPFSSDGHTNSVRRASATVAAPTTAGGHTIYLCGANTGSNPISIQSASVVATFSAVGVADQ